MSTQATELEVRRVEHGSLEHAAILGLREATDEDTLTYQGYTLVDTTVFGPQATETYVKEVLRQKVSELLSGAPPTPQSEDPFAPNYAPPMWLPYDVDSGEMPARGIV